MGGSKHGPYSPMVFDVQDTYRKPWYLGVLAEGNRCAFRSPQAYSKLSAPILSIEAMRELVHVQGGQCGGLNADSCSFF